MKQLFLVLLFSFLFSCICNAQIMATNEQIDTDFFIPVERSNLYARVIGNPNKPILITLHGGPGAFNVDREFFRDIFEADYLVVYFDQRGSGKSDEFRDKSMLTTEQFVRDLDVVVDSIKNKYPNKKINIIGSSWGGTYGLLYLIKYQEKINAFICNSGVADIQHSNFALIKHEKELASKLLKETSDSIKINRYQEILNALAVIEKSGFTDFFNDMNTIRYDFSSELGFDVYWAKPELKVKIENILKDPEFYIRVKYTPELWEESMARFEYINAVFHEQEAYNNLNILNELAGIKTPILVLQGDLDYAIGVESGKLIYRALKSVQKKDKELVYIKNASHNVPTEAPKEFRKALKTFLAKHN